MAYYTSQLQLLENNQLSPSSATWDILYTKNWLPDVTLFLAAVALPTQVPNGTCVAINHIETNLIIVENSLPTSELYSAMICGNILSHVVQELNEKSGIKLYRFDTEPPVQEEEDARNNKTANFSIFKIRNKRTYVTVEVKLDVPEKLSKRTRTDLSQLFLESIYCCRKEKINRMLAILTDGFIWHNMALDVSRFPISIEKYFRIKINPEDTPKDVCNTLMQYILTNCYQKD